jgi:hypothetical protein
MSGRRHEHEFEPEFGLPERLPAHERILWQGAPGAWGLALRVFHLPAVALYFAAILALRFAFVVNDGASTAQALHSVALIAPLFGFALACLAGLAWATARTSAYTITDRRVVMRVGIVLSVTYNLPFARIEGAARSSHGDLALVLAKGDQIAWLHLWPHVRPWRLRHTEPMLRCLADADAVAALLTQAWSRATGLAAQRAEAAPVAAGSAPVFAHH